MKIILNLKKIELFSILLAFVMIMLLAISGIIAIADGLYQWNILPENLEIITILSMLVMGVVLLACIILVVLLSLSRMASNLEKIAEISEIIKDKENENR